MARWILHADIWKDQSWTAFGLGECVSRLAVETKGNLNLGLRTNYPPFWLLSFGGFFDYYLIVPRLITNLNSTNQT